MSSVGEQAADPGAEGASPGPLWAGRADPRSGFSQASLVIGIALVAATFFLIGPPRGETYPGARPWGQYSLLRPLTALMSLNGWIATARGTEVKDFALHLAASAGLLILAGRLWRVPVRWLPLPRWAEPWVAAQLLLASWVAISAFSGLWSGDALMSCGQAALYALLLMWSLGLAWTLEPRDVPRLLGALIVIPALGSALCIWYFVERNPYHRPGFPIGNPGTLAATLVPAIVLSCGIIGGAVGPWWRNKSRRVPWALVGALVALVPLVGCFGLTNSRSATVGLVIGLATLLFFQVGRRMRWVMAGGMVLGLALAAVWLESRSRVDTALARSETIRFRFYAWRYAADLWNQSWITSIAGQGAGSYPRLAGQLSIQDRMLDPGAFMGELVEHAHNELFEVLAEIGLVGGVSFVGGWLAALAAGAALLRVTDSPERRWLRSALVASMAGVMADGLLSPGLRLAGVPAVFYTLLGSSLALCRSGGPTAPGTLGTLIANAAGKAPGLARFQRLAALAVATLAVGAAGVTLRNFAGVLHEERGHWEFDNGRFDEARADFGAAQVRLLDPWRQLASQSMALQAGLAAARDVCAALAARMDGDGLAMSRPTGGALDEGQRLWQAAVERCLAVEAAADALALRAPTLLYAATAQATASELLGELHQRVGSPEARQWWQRAGQAWLVQRAARPFNAEALLALMQYPWPLDFRVGLLRDALRSPQGYDRWGRAMSFDELRRRWQQALARMAPEAGFEQILGGMLAGIGPVTAESGLVSLEMSRAPEANRLKAHFESLQQRWPEAQQYAASAVRLYEAMRHRFPVLESVALLEQADFTLLESPARADAAAGLLREALRKLPRIQQQKQEALALPFESRLVVCLVAAGDEAGAAGVIRGVLGADASIEHALANAYVDLTERFVRRPPLGRPPIEPWLAAALEHEPGHFGAWSWKVWLAAERRDLDAVHGALAAARRAGLGPADVGRIRAALAQQFPDLAEALRAGD